jgi:Transcriptional regulator
MGRKERKQSDIQTRRNEILDAAEHLYEKEESDQVTMDKIAAEAEYTKQTLYRYFSNKEEILASVYVRAVASINTAFEQSISALKNTTGYEMLESLKSAFVHIAATRPLYIKMMAIFQSKDIHDYEDMGIMADIQSQSERLGNIMLQCITRGIEDQSIAQDIDLQNALLFINVLISGAVCFTVFHTEYQRETLKTDPLQSFEKIMEFSMRAFRNPDQLN